MVHTKSKGICWRILYRGKGPSFCSPQAFNCLDEAICFTVQITLISSKNTLVETPSLMFDQIFRHPMAQSSWHIKVTITMVLLVTEMGKLGEAGLWASVMTSGKHKAQWTEGVLARPEASQLVRSGPLLTQRILSSEGWFLRSWQSFHHWLLCESNITAASKKTEKKQTAQPLPQQTPTV